MSIAIGNELFQLTTRDNMDADIFHPFQKRVARFSRLTGRNTCLASFF